MNKITKIEALRGFVALYVALAHVFVDRSHFANYNFSFLWQYGDAGVAIFFVISGFVIQLSYEKSKDKSFKLYFFKRFFRIYIPLIIIFITNFLILFFQNDIYGFSYERVITNLLMLQNLNDSNSIFMPLFNNGPLWSLAYEWWYYMMFFFLATYLSKYSSKIVYIVSLVSCIIYLFYSVFVVQMMIDMSLWWMGVEVAKLYLRKERQSLSNLKIPLFVIFIEILILYMFNENGDFYIHLLKGFICILIGLFWYSIQWKYFDKTIGLFLPLGRISYTLYISHWFLIHQAVYLNKYIYRFGAFRYLIYFIICILFCYVVEVLLYPILNKYFMQKIFPFKYIINQKLNQP